MLTGGCFQNARLAEGVLRRLQRDFDVRLHGEVPPGDGGIALGQALVADAVAGLSEGRRLRGRVVEVDDEPGGRMGRQRARGAASVVLDLVPEARPGTPCSSTPGWPCPRESTPTG